jgi:hypothetical protein
MAPKEIIAISSLYILVMLNAAWTVTELRTLALLLAAQIHATPKQAKVPKDFPNRKNYYFYQFSLKNRTVKMLKNG